MSPRSTGTRAGLALSLGAGLLLIAATPAAAHSPGTAPPAVELRVASYNIAAGRDADGAFDIASTADAIERLDADVIALQEVDVHWGERSLNLDLAEELADALDMQVDFAPIYSNDPVEEGQPRAEYGVAVLSDYPIVDFTNHEITRLSTQSEDAEPAPAPGFAEAVVQARGARVHVYSTHLDYRGDPTVRELQVADTLEIMAEDGPHASQILMGDFNASPEAAELTPLWHRLTDAYAAAGAGDGFTFPAVAPDRRIDYVTVSARITVQDAFVPGDGVAATASDHRPVVADLELPRGRQH
ncbi:MAG TPA: endonuclease/exonuclease/phosphatase family protein [Candidatus Ruania gallistercoris]|uniref:Endonuclease/exonuclease/phosphatase family protein n=1 Tax=Candidatus Ruania gallistercoris TaxID=2838746 RepID=A0A9D2J664_9MICO|nr:endonuclease/exonuclease/phosphatase family protein [Candidatus Ruania gallistercoris]